MLHVRRIEVDHVIEALFGNEVEQFFRGFPVGIEERDSLPDSMSATAMFSSSVLLSDAGFANHVYVPAAIVKLDAELLLGFCRDNCGSRSA